MGADSSEQGEVPMSDLVSYRMFIDGAWIGAEDGRTFQSLNPATGEAWAEIPEATVGDVDRAVRAAHLAFTEGPWATATATERGRTLRKLADLLADKSEDLGRTETIDTGKMLKETRWQAKYIAEFFHYYAGCADKIHGATLPIDKPDLCVFTMREPLGVVAAVVPWNSQLFLVAVKLGPALAAGRVAPWIWLIGANEAKHRRRKVFLLNLFQSNSPRCERD